ncbi:DUF2391 domain-containing protein [Natronosalvus caseinilyticus]|uniref:DUF2391 domain-containing protein n=1 Tax=Natronosalvus caseinilyticus TaxID=2953747 RepID=UPI0028A76427|nr:DUF2391 domain-containing protein [Natronosalvus caseinilyticus]
MTADTHASGASSDDVSDPDIEDLLDKLDELKDAADDPGERRRVEETIHLVNRMPGSQAFTKRITKYTTKDIAQAFVGSVIFALPLLVEDGVFDIAEWFLSVTLGGVPVFFVANLGFLLAMTAGLLYYADFRQVEVRKPILGVIPRRYAGVLVVSLLASVAMMLMWGQLTADEPTAMEQVSRVTVVWTVAAFGAALGDILPGESTDEDISDRL